LTTRKRQDTVAAFAPPQAICTWKVCIGLERAA